MSSPKQISGERTLLWHCRTLGDCDRVLPAFSELNLYWAAVAAVDCISMSTAIGNPAPLAADTEIHVWGNRMSSLQLTLSKLLARKLREHDVGRFFGYNSRQSRCLNVTLTIYLTNASRHVR